MSYRSNRESGENMKKKKIFALAMAGCMLFTQPALAEELQEGIDDAIVIPEDAQEDNNSDVLLQDGEEQFFVNDSSSEYVETERANFAGRAAEEGKTGKSVLLDSSAVTYLSEHREIPCAEQGGIYFLNKNKLSLYKPDSNKLTEVHQFDNVRDVYVANDRLYILGYNSNITIYNLLTQQEEKKLQYGDHASSIGVDAKGRIYLAESNGNGDDYDLYLLSPEGTLLSQALSEEAVYGFYGFDESNGNYYVDTYNNWYYWGYDHDMHALRAGNVTGDQLTFHNKTLMLYICQSYFYEREEQVSMLGDKYVCIDSTFNSGLSIWDSDVYKSEEPENTEVLFLSRNNEEGGEFDPAASVGTRTIYREETDSIITFKNNSFIAEYDVQSGEEICSAKTDYPVFCLMEYEGGVAAVEKSGENYYYEFFPWKKATNLEIEGSGHTVNIAETLQLTPVTNGTMEEVYSWKSSDPKIASINQSGQVFGWKKGEAVITVSTTGGLSAQCTVTVTGEPPVQNPDKAATVTDGQVSDNHSLNDYTVWSKTVNSYLIPNADGTFMRVEHSGGKMIVETYSASGKKAGSKTVAMELKLFGGFYSGSDYNYFVFGQENPNDSDEQEVMRVVKYSKDFQRIGAVSVKGANTNIPFEAGSLRMTETAGKLYIHTCHEMYPDQDGVNHQANMTFVINETDMSVEQSYYDVLNIAQAGYVSHSFNQFIQTDGENIYRVDHGDSAPRGIALVKSQVGGLITEVEYVVPVRLGNVTGGHYNATGASVGGFEMSSENCIIAGNAVNFEGESASTLDQRNIFVSVTDKGLSRTKVVWLTNYDKQQNVNVQTPQLVKIGEDQFLVMWQEGSKYEGNLTTKIVTIDSDGNKTSDIKSKSMPLSDCQPVVGPDGVVRWYVTDNSAPTIYAVNPFAQSPLYMKGDVDENGKVEIADLRLILRSVCKKVELTEQQKLAADVTEDGKVEIVDLRKVLRYVCHKITEL